MDKSGKHHKEDGHDHHHSGIFGKNTELYFGITIYLEKADS